MEPQHVDVVDADLTWQRPDQVIDAFPQAALVNVVHDWSDEDAGRVLRSVAAAAGETALVVVVEGERRPRPGDDITARADLLMLALAPGGRERTGGEPHDLARSAGLAHRASVVLPSADRGHLYRRP